MSRPLKPRCPRCSFRRTLVPFDGRQKVCSPCRAVLRREQSEHAREEARHLDNTATKRAREGAALGFKDWVYCYGCNSRHEPINVGSDCRRPLRFDNMPIKDSPQLYVGSFVDPNKQRHS